MHEIQLAQAENFAQIELQARVSKLSASVQNARLRKQEFQEFQLAQGQPRCEAQTRALLPSGRTWKEKSKHSGRELLCHPCLCVGVCVSSGVDFFFFFLRFGCFFLLFLLRGCWWSALRRGRAGQPVWCLTRLLTPSFPALIFLIHHITYPYITMSLPDFTQAANLTKLDGYLADKSYVDG